jgi:flagellar L-ring protein precursor FlgH
MKGALAVCAALALTLGGCDTFDHFQQPPRISSPGSIGQIPPINQSSQAVQAAREGDPYNAPAMRGSLWRPGSKTFFRDPRARTVGDLLTVVVSVQENGEFANQTQLQRTTANGISISGLGTMFSHLMSSVSGNAVAVNTTGNGQTNGQGDIKRAETLNINVAATVTAVLANGNFEIAGSQEIRLNNELRELQIRGIIRPEDILSDNTIASEKIAEARIAYGGRGVSSDLQRPTWGQDILTRFQPF